MALTPTQAKDLAAALRTAFPTVSALAQMVRFGLGENLADISTGGNLQAQVFELITWAEANGKVSALLTAAQEANPENPELQAVAAALATERGQPTFRPPTVPETFVPRPGPYAQLRAAVLAADPAQPVALTTTLQGPGVSARPPWPLRCVPTQPCRRPSLAGSGG